jgi:hypothetical protein
VNIQGWGLWQVFVFIVVVVVLVWAASKIIPMFT